MDAVHKSGVETVEFLQNSLPSLKDANVWISWIGDPRYVYLIYFPVMFAFNCGIGVKVLWSAAIAEWINHILKWLLHGERPYWWGGEHAHVWTDSNEKVPVFEQYPISCETGPGSPSGHMMITSSALYIIVRYFSIQAQFSRKDYVSKLIWTVYLAWMTVVAVSRVFIAAHFPHQCVAGFLGGLLIGYVVDRLQLDRLSLKAHVMASLGLLASAMATYLSLTALGLDPGWTFPLAVKWCAQRRWVHLTTTPFYMMWRYVGTVIGVGLGVRFSLTDGQQRLDEASDSTRLVRVLVSCFLALVWDKVIRSAHFENVYFSYSVCLAQNVAIPYAVMVGVPWLVAKIVKPQSGGKVK